MLKTRKNTSIYKLVADTHAGLHCHGLATLLLDLGGATRAVWPDSHLRTKVVATIETRLVFMALALEFVPWWACRLESHYPACLLPVQVAAPQGAMSPCRADSSRWTTALAYGILRRVGGRDPRAGFRPPVTPQDSVTNVECHGTKGLDAQMSGRSRWLVPSIRVVEDLHRCHAGGFVARDRELFREASWQVL